jgi:GNS1/SUR4 family
MSSPLPTLSICLSYVYIVKVLGPKFMENRKPFELRRVLIAYNAFQVLFSTWLFYEVRPKSHTLKKPGHHFQALKNAALVGHFLFNPSQSTFRRPNITKFYFFTLWGKIPLSPTPHLSPSLTQENC